MEVKQYNITPPVENKQTKLELTSITLIPPGAVWQNVSVTPATGPRRICTSIRAVPPLVNFVPKSTHTDQNLGQWLSVNCEISSLSFLRMPEMIESEFLRPCGVVIRGG